MSEYPKLRLRRLRNYKWLSELVKEYTLSVEDLILPIFIREGKGLEEEIPELDVRRYSIDKMLIKVKQALDLGIKAVALFPYVEAPLKCNKAFESYNENNLICRATKALKDKFTTSLGIITDIALDPYLPHGHDGILNNNQIDNDKTIDILCLQALAYVKAGCDIVAPSDMMDGRISKIRTILDQNNFPNTTILSYAVKYNSCFYTPFRKAIGSTQVTPLDKSTYQLNPCNGKEALREIALDLQEGADLIMIKPSLSYLDIIREASNKFNVPIFAYQVSGEYYMLKKFHPTALMESLISIKRAGAKSIFTYGAIEIAQLLNE